MGSNAWTRRTHWPVDASTQPATRRRLLGLTAGGGAVLAGALLAGAGGAKDVSAQASRSLVGAWLLTISAAQGDPNEHELASFTSDGNAILTNSPTSLNTDNPRAAPTRSYSTSGHGAWVQTGNGTYRLTFYFVDVDESGMFSVLVKVTANVGVSADGVTVTGGFAVSVTDAGGNVLFASDGDAGTVQGTRIVA